MVMFWILAALVSSAAALLMVSSASRAERRATAADPTIEVYRRQLLEIDELADRGLLGEEERKAARAEAGRRLLGEADRAQAPAPSLSGKSARRLATAAAIAVPLLALAGYMLTGSPGFPDQPYKARLKSWLQLSRTDPGRLSLPEMAAVLQTIVAERPRDPEAREYLAEVEAAGGDLAGAARDLEKVTDLQPSNAKAWLRLGVVLTEQAQGQVSDEAVQAFQRAQALEPSAVEPRYFLARTLVLSGHAAQGLAAWRALLGAMASDDPRRATVAAEIDSVEKTGRLPADETDSGAAEPAQGGQEAAFIQSMVDRLAARLKAQPDDPEGWARLIRAYGVLHQSGRQAAAQAEARRLFKNRPDALRTALAGAAAPSP